jgi:nucleoside 2-deoxyribosyltransferase
MTHQPPDRAAGVVWYAAAMAAPRIYVGCGLTHASDALKADVDALKERLRLHYSVLDFIGLEDSTAAEVYRHDTACVDTCDLFVAICDEPSTGLGMEIARAIAHQRPTLAVAHESARVSRQVLGAPEHEPAVWLYRYRSLDELDALVANHLPPSAAW